MLIVKKSVTHQDIGGKPFIIDEQVTQTLSNDEVFDRGIMGNWACNNFMDRREDFNCNFPHKLYYGKVGNLGYIVAEDELEEVPDEDIKFPELPEQKKSFFSKIFGK